MNRPMLMRILPGRLRMSAWARLYRGSHNKWRGLYDAAPLGARPFLTMELVPGDVISDQIAFTGYYERPLTRRLCELSQSGGLFVEVGANLGYFSLLWAAGNAANRCVSFEASPRNIDYLRRNVARNRLEDQVQVVPHAAGREAGTLHFDVGPQEQTGWGGFASGESSRTIEVEVVRVDEIIPHDADVAMLKIDTEGADTWALMGCEELLRKQRIKEVQFEQNKPRMRELGIGEGEAEEYLRSMGYRVEPVGDPGDEKVDWRAVPGSRP